MSTSIPVEPRAKRTHARRSCELCKVRKTRCELPDIDVSSSGEALPIDKACHRCKVLALPCVVDDIARKPSKKRARAEEVETSTSRNGGASVSKASRGKSGARPTAEKKDSGEGIDHSLEIMQGIHPGLEWTGSHGEPALYSSDPFLRSSPIMSTFGSAGLPTNVMKLHGRPLELVCMMLRTSYAKSEIKGGRSALTYEKIDWGTLVDKSMRSRLELGFAQLRTFHPYLDPFPAIFDKCSTSPETEDQLLLSTIIYLCTLPLAPSPLIADLRSYLRPRIAFLRDRLLIHAPRTFMAIQALELLGVHAPLGVVPLQLIDPQSVSVARGPINMLQTISSHLGFSTLFSGLASRESDTHRLWDLPDCLLYLAVAALEASMTLEDEVPRAPASLKETKKIATQYMDESHEYLWRNGVDNLAPSCYIGRLSLFDRICRLGEVLDSLERLRRVLDIAAVDMAYNPVDAIVEEFTFFAQKMDRCDSRHDTVLSFITPISHGLERGYQTHRSLRRRYEHIKILATGLRYLIATAYIPGTRLALPSVPSDIPSHQRVNYAISRASNPADIMPVISQNSPANMLIWQYGAHRGEISQQIINGLADLDTRVIPRPPTSSSNLSADTSQAAELIPWHDCIVIAVESAKALMEMRAGTLAIAKRSGNTHEATLPPIWVNSLKKACHTLRLIGLLSPPNIINGVDKEKGPGEGETVANGCSNILGSMVRLTEEWGRQQSGNRDEVVTGSYQNPYPGGENKSLPHGNDLEQYRSNPTNDPSTNHHQQTNQNLHDTYNSGYHNPNPNPYPSSDQHHTGEPYPAPYAPHPGPPGQDGQGDPGSYMDSSDRWLSGPGPTNDETQNPYSSPHQPNHLINPYQTPNPNPSSPYQNGSNGGPNHPPGPGSNAPHSQNQNQSQSQGYQGHSHVGPPPPPPNLHQLQSLPQHHQTGDGQQEAGYAPTALDLLLSQMFHYGPPQQ